MTTITCGRNQVEIESAAKGKSNPTQIRVVTVAESSAFYQLDSPEAALEYWNENVATSNWFDAGKETAVVLLCDVKYRIIAFNLVSIGTVNETILQPRDVFRPAIALGAFAVVVMHNHPSGDPTPSKLDLSATKQIKDCGELLGVKLLDHIIVGTRAGFSIECGHKVL